MGWWILPRVFFYYFSFFVSILCHFIPDTDGVAMAGVHLIIGIMVDTMEDMATHIMAMDGVRFQCEIWQSTRFSNLVITGGIWG